MKLEIDVANDGSSLLVGYILTNVLAKAVYACLLHRDPSQGAFAPGAYVYHEPPNRVLLFSGTPPPPPLVSLYWPGTPGAIRLDPGVRSQGSLRLPLPLLEADMLTGPDPAAPHERVLVDEVRFCVEYVPRTWLMDVTEYPGDPGVYQVSQPFERALAAARLATPCALQRRTDGFHRFAL